MLVALAEPVNQILKTHSLNLKYIFNTHHHYDHVGANLELKETHKCEVVAYAGDLERIPGHDIAVEEGDFFPFGEHKFEILYTPGHTLGHIAYFSKEDNILFCGDTLFSAGCGRLFEGSPKQMWNSLKSLKSLGDNITVYCTHEYTLSNLKFALSLAPNWPGLREFSDLCEEKRSRGEATVPTLLKREKMLNPFLLCDNEEYVKTLGMTGKEASEVLKEIRLLKDNF